jgi:hypothetical protein
MNVITQNLLIGLLVLMLAVLWLIGAHSASPDVPCMDEQTREKIRALMLAGTEDAFKDHTKHMFEIWMKDQSDQPARAITGMKVAIHAFVNTRNAALRFNPPVCKEQ